MSNWKRAYGWCGHILVDEDDEGCVIKPRDTEQNVVAVPHKVIQALLDAIDNNNLDPRIEGQRIGVQDSDYVVLACGVGMSIGFQYYGGVFNLADDYMDGTRPQADCPAKEYMAAMFELYNLKLPLPRMMIGCSVEGE